MRATLIDLIAQDIAETENAEAIADVDKLLHFYRDLYRLCTNFVNFKDFYDPDQAAIFQVGTLYLDQRSCHLCLPVADPAKHATLAALAGACLVYCDCTRKVDGARMQIAAVFTDGDSDNLMVGRNGIFYDRQGRDWDANVVKVVDNPISLRQAFWSPYKKLARLIEEQVAKRASSGRSGFLGPPRSRGGPHRHGRQGQAGGTQKDRHRHRGRHRDRLRRRRHLPGHC